jgi:biotin synthase-related radical SAM superfamily protein
MIMQNHGTPSACGRNNSLRFEAFTTQFHRPQKKSYSLNDVHQRLSEQNVQT